MDLIARVHALKHAQSKLEESRNEAVAERMKHETKPGLLMGLSGRVKRERAEGLKAALDDKFYYDGQIGKIESLISLLSQEISRWLDCCLKTLAADYPASLARHDYPEDWSRLGYRFDVLVKTLQMDLKDLKSLYRSENPSGPRSPQHDAAIGKILPTARQVEIDIEFLNNILAHQTRIKGTGADETPPHPEYGWCETIELLGNQSVPAAMETLRELIALAASFLPALRQEIRREQAVAEEKAALASRKGPPSYLACRWEGLKPAAAQGMTARQSVAVIAETEALFLDGEFSARFNRYLIKSIVRSSSQPARETARAGAARATPDDAELKGLKDTLELELEGVAKLKANLTRRERTLRESEQAFEEKRQREQAELDEARARVAVQEEEVARKLCEVKKRFVAEQKRLEALIEENTARAAFIDESEQRLMSKGQEQIERLAELEQQEDEIMAAKRELNEMRKEMGLPLVPLRTKPVDEFAE